MGVSLQAIAQRANVGVGMAYHNFPTKDAIIEAVHRAEVESRLQTGRAS